MTARAVGTSLPEEMVTILFKTLQEAGGRIYYQELLTVLEKAWSEKSWGDIPRGLDPEYCAQQMVQYFCREGSLHHDRSGYIVAGGAVSFRWLRETLLNACNALNNIIPDEDQAMIQTNASLTERDNLAILADFATAYNYFVPIPREGWVPGAHEFFGKAENLQAILLGDESWRSKAKTAAARARKKWRKERAKRKKSKV